MTTYTHMDKTQKDRWLPRLFDLYHNNMNAIAPSGLSYEDERAKWFDAVSPALDKAPRQILLCCSDGELGGYIQYYTRSELLMIEEVQLRADFQRSTVFLSLSRALIRMMPEEIHYVEAYADRRNFRSIDLMQRLGMEQLIDEAGFAHFRGLTEKIQFKFLR